uniref:Uncharacterized protein n=1 Tax=Anthurium amnicola TaxID=1678845 RepID=A0A1D1XCN1_9ARAE
MRISYHLISLAILFSSVFVSAGPAPDNNGNTCSSCWVEERNKLPECQNVPQTEISEFSKLTDEEIIAKKDDFPKLIPCLCALVPKVPAILDECNCNQDDATALTKESKIVKTLCAKVIDDNNTSANNSNTNTTNNKPNKSGGKNPDGSGDDSVPGDGSGAGSYDNSTITNTTGNDSNPVPLASAAISAQWAGSFIVTLGAVVVALVL